MKIVVFSYEAEILTHQLWGTTNATAPDKGTAADQ
jgi:hypothetical protein